VKHFFPEPADASERALLARVNEDGACCAYKMGQGRTVTGAGSSRRAESPDLARLTPELLREITAHEGCDFATALLHRTIVESERHGPFLRALSEQSHRPPLKVTVAIVPGAFHRENPRTGADGRLVREVAAQLGLPVIVAPVASTGSLGGNARLIAAWLRESSHQRLILVSVCKGGSDVKAALARPDAGQLFASVGGWISLCGILDGTPMADWLLSPSLLARANRFVYRIRGRSLDFLEELRRFPGCALDFPLNPPASLRVAHVVGFPLRRHLRNGLARRCHARLEAFGPNDGALLLADTPRWPGQLCPVWGADHYLRPREDVRPLLAALLRHFAL